MDNSENNEESDDVFGLITELCGCFSDDIQKIKKLRSQCYELLLKKRTPVFQSKFPNLKETSDPSLNILAWRFRLINEFNLKTVADQIGSCVESLEESCLDDELLENSMKFLLNLRDIPPKDSNKLDLSSLPAIDKFLNFNDIFKLPADLLKETENFKKSLSTSKIQNQHQNEYGKSSSLSKSHDDIFDVDDGYSSPIHNSKDDVILWDEVSKLKYSNRRTWESYGYPEPDKERPFLSELGDLSSLWVGNLESLYFGKQFSCGTSVKIKTISREAFISDLKCLLVGLASETFNHDEFGRFYLIPDINLEGVTPEAVDRFCNTLTFCGTCCKALNEMISRNPDTGRYKRSGYIFKEFCEGINRFLKFYRLAIFNIPNATNYFDFYEKTHPLQQQIYTLASICRIGPFKENDRVLIPSGITILNNLYKEMFTLANHKVILMLYSLLYACFQVYFSHFLSRWILEGVIDDPYGEFFIQSNMKYLTTRGRAFWTKCYVIKDDMMLDFLADSSHDILYCGKAMHLLKSCYNSSPLCLYLSRKTPLIIYCCLTLNQISMLRQNTAEYYLNVSKVCGSKFNFDHVLMKSMRQDPLFISLVAKKRALTIKRLELERLEKINKQKEKKLEELSSLREQYEMFMEEKQLRIVDEVKNEMEQMQQQISLDKKFEEFVKKEADNMIEFYAELIDTAEKRKSKIDANIKLIKSIHFDDDDDNQCLSEPKEHFQSTENIPDKISTNNNSSSSSDSFYSVAEDVEKEPSTQIEKEPSTQIEKEPSTQIEKEETTTTVSQIHSSQSMDLINANANTNDNENQIKITNNTQQQVIDNFKMAEMNKRKVMMHEMGIDLSYTAKTTNTKEPTLTEDVIERHLTAAQRNKLKVMSSEFGIKYKMHQYQYSTQALQNRDKVMGISDCFQQLDNACHLNKNIVAINPSSNNNETTTALKKSTSLSIDIDKANSRISAIPMSVDSTPMSELTTLATPNTPFLQLNQALGTPTTTITETSCSLGGGNEAFNFTKSSNQHQLPQRSVVFDNSSDGIVQEASPPMSVVFCKRISRTEAKSVSINPLKLFLKESIQIPLATQLALINDELLKYFVNDLKYFDHLSNLRDYFFMQNGDFARSIMDNLFTKLYEATYPKELLNCHTLTSLVFDALDVTTSGGKNSTNTTVRRYLSFKINSVPPECFDLEDPDALRCISLTYNNFSNDGSSNNNNNCSWPLNIILPSDAVAKYGEVFRFVLKLHWMSWVMKKIFLDMKILSKETNTKQMYLMSSPQFRRLHQCRHVMTQFVQSLQNYVVGEVLQSSWENFTKSLSDVNSLDELYNAHTVYIKKILFMCLLNRKTEIFRSVLHKIFTVILKFYNYLRSRQWKCVEGLYTHPNFQKLDSIFKNFEELVVYFNKIGRKVVRCGYQPHLLQLLDTLDINGYFSESLKSNVAPLE